MNSSVSQKKHSDSASDSFVDLAAYHCARPVSKSVPGTLIKAHEIACNGSRTIEVEAGSSDQPAVVIHREGDIITAIEVTCTCGASTVISLEY